MSSFIYIWKIENCKIYLIKLPIPAQPVVEAPLDTLAAEPGRQDIKNQLLASLLVVIFHPNQRAWRPVKTIVYFLLVESIVLYMYV